MPIETLTTTIAQTTTIVSLISIGLFGLTWVIASLLRGSFIPFKDWREWGHSMQLDVVKASFLLALYSSISSLITWIVNAIASAA